MALLLLLPSCSVSNDSTPSTGVVKVAGEYAGLHERTDREELKDLLNVDPTRTEWCAAFVNSVLEIQGHPNLHTMNYPYPLTARGFLHWGESVDFYDEIQIGDIVIFPRGNQGWQGHVGFYVGSVGEDWIILGGNQDNKVGYNLYKSYNAIGIRRLPSD